MRARRDRLKVCLVSGLYPPWVLGGAELYVETLVRALAHQAEVVVLTTCPPSWRSWRPRRADADGARVYRYFPLNAYFLPRFARATAARRAAFHLLDVWNPHSFLATRAVLRRERPDVVHVHHLQGMSGAALSAAGSLGLPAAMTLHDYGLWCRRGTALHGTRPCGPRDLLCRAHERVQRRASAAVRLVIGPSRFALEAHCRRGFFSAARREVLRNPIAAAPLAAAAGNGAERFEILYLGQLAPHKGVDVLLRAVLGEPDPRWRLQVVGEGEREAALRALAGGDPRVRFRGRVDAQERDRLLGGADVLVLPSRWDENAPLVALEAFRAGVPIVASAVGGLPELVRAGETGLLVPPGEEAALRGALRRLARNADERAALGAGARAVVAAHNLEGHVQTLLGWYAELAAGG